MKQTSSIVTAAGTVSAATLVPIINWLLHGCIDPMPESVPYLIASFIVAFGHFIYNLAQSKTANSLESPSTPTVDQPVVQPTDKAAQ